MTRQLTEEDIGRVRELVAAGNSYESVKDTTGFSVTTISRIARDVCQRSRGKPKRSLPVLTDAIRERIDSVKKLLEELPGKREVLVRLGMTASEYDSLRYQCRVHGLPPMKSSSTGRPPTRRGVLREIEDRKERGEDMDAILSSLSPRKRALINK